MTQHYVSTLMFHKKTIFQNVVENYRTGLEVKISFSISNILYVTNIRRLITNETGYSNKTRFRTLTAAGGHGLNSISYV